MHRRKHGKVEGVEDRDTYLYNSHQNSGLNKSIRLLQFGSRFMHLPTGNMSIWRFSRMWVGAAEAKVKSGAKKVKLVKSMVAVDMGKCYPFDVLFEV